MFLLTTGSRGRRSRADEHSPRPRQQRRREETSGTRPAQACELLAEHGGAAAQRLLLRPRTRQLRHRCVLQLPRLLRRARLCLHCPALGGRRQIHAAMGRGSGRRRKPSEGGNQLRVEPPQNPSLRRADHGRDPPAARAQQDAGEYFDWGPIWKKFELAGSFRKIKLIRAPAH